jgi:hypothetical protein
MERFIWLLISVIGTYIGYRLLRIGLQRGVEPGIVTRCPFRPLRQFEDDLDPSGLRIPGG